MTSPTSSDVPTYRSPLLDRPGAAEAQGPDSAVDATGVAWHYGDPLREQRAAHDGTVVVDRSHRRVIRVAGPDAPEFLNNLLSQKLDDVPAGFAAAALDLDIQGRILHHADVLRTGEAFYLDLPAADAVTFLGFLQKMVFWSQVEITEPDLAVLTLLGSLDLPEIDTAAQRDVPWSGVPRRDLLVERAALDETVAALEAAGVQLAGLMAFTAERVRALEPEKNVDLDDKSIPHEVPAWIGQEGRPGAVHLEKGCYRGQETVARVENLGRSPRVLVMLQLDGSAPEPPAPGSEITGPQGGRALGRLGTVVHDCDFGPVALALVRRNALEREDLCVGPVAVNVDPTSLPEEAGEQAGRAAIDKLRGR
ncbi:folate-binding protein [Corynebacterium hylobatis]|uniref:Folate-binding protein n=1 Tax=Corynebacterium hylobatis TaxID=1859290 RepID=A0A3R9ZHN8_9CORY|nr:folate-binding protein YgfZ [Corynebacterium hylobatis]RSZ61569.1 folate-binding protein [Corynebacterium hylobatis]